MSEERSVYNFTFISSPGVELNIDLAMKLGLLRLRCPRCNASLENSHGEEYYYCTGARTPDDQGDCDFYVQISDDWVTVGRVGASSWITREVQE